MMLFCSSVFISERLFNFADADFHPMASSDLQYFGEHIYCLYIVHVGSLGIRLNVHADKKMLATCIKDIL